MVQVAPSILAADFARLGEELERVRTADLLHIDVMDGVFVPNISIGPGVVAAIRDRCALPFDVHLMLLHPYQYIESFCRAGADRITFHVECADEAGRVLAKIRECGVQAGVALNPETPPQALADLPRLDSITVMTVRPGFGGQKLNPKALEKIAALKQARPGTLLEVDGGVCPQNAAACVRAGADILVAGTAVFQAEDPENAISSLRKTGVNDPQRKNENYVNS